MNNLVEETSRTASEYELKAAEDNDLAKIAMAQVKTFDFSIYDPNKKCWKNTGDTFKYDVNRDVFISYQIYAVHSFTNHNDYYLVLCDASTTPRNFKDTTRKMYDSDIDETFEFNFLHGYTRGYYIEQYVDNGSMSSTQVGLIKAIPNNLNRSTTHSETLGWSIGGSIGFSGKSAEGSINASVEYSNTTTWETTEYSIVNECRTTYPAITKWRMDMQLPTDGSKHKGGSDGHYYGVNATNASKNNLNLHSEWVWSVAPDYWRNHSNITMKIKSHVEDGYTTGEAAQWHGFLNLEKKYYSRDDDYYSYDRTASLTLNRPVHVASSTSTLLFPSKAASGNAFSILSEGDWSISSNVNWLTFTKTSGTATGDSAYAIMTDIAENTSSSPREGTITVKSGTEEITIQVLQSGN